MAVVMPMMVLLLFSFTGMLKVDVPPPTLGWDLLPLALT